MKGASSPKIPRRGFLAAVAPASAMRSGYIRSLRSSSGWRNPIGVPGVDARLPRALRHKLQSAVPALSSPWQQPNPVHSRALSRGRVGGCSPPRVSRRSTPLVRTVPSPRLEHLSPLLDAGPHLARTANRVRAHSGRVLPVPPQMELAVGSGNRDPESLQAEPGQRLGLLPMWGRPVPARSVSSGRRNHLTDSSRGGSGHPVRQRMHLHLSAPQHGLRSSGRLGRTKLARPGCGESPRRRGALKNGRPVESGLAGPGVVSASGPPSAIAASRRLHHIAVRGIV